MTRRLSIRISIVTATLLLLVATAVPAQIVRQESPVFVGELRLFAVDPDNHDAIDALHHAGWIEADGRTLKRDDFALLFAGIGRVWTSKKVAADRFALPDLVARRANAANPYGVLGPGDLVGGGREIAAPPTPTYFIYSGKDAGAERSRP